MTKNSLEAFSDGIIAIIITITILLIDLPEGDDLASLLHIFRLFAIWCDTSLYLVVPWALPKPARGLHPLGPCPLAGEAGKQQSLFPAARVIRVASARAFAA